MVPHVKDAHLDQAIDPGLGQQVRVVRLAETGADAREDFVVQAMLEAAERGAEDSGFSSPLIADEFGPFDADQRRDVTQPAELLGDLCRNKVPVREDLEIRVRVGRQDVQQALVHQRLAAQQPEERVPHAFGFSDHPVQGIDVDPLLLRRDVDPATLAAEVAAVDDRDVQVRREELASFQAAFMPLDRAITPPAHIPAQLPQQSLIRFEQGSFCQTKVHRSHGIRGVRKPDGVL